MWVPLAILVLAAVLLAGPLRRFAGSESMVAFGLTAVAVVVLFQMDRLA